MENIDSHLNMENAELDDMMCIEVQINSFEPVGEQFSSPRSSPKKHAKRKNQDNVRDSAPKKCRSADSNKELSNSNISDEGSKIRTKKGKHTSRSKKNDVYIDHTELKNVLEGMTDEIDNVLEETAQKNRLTATNVKNILRHVITNEYVLAMVRNTMKAENNEGDDLEEAIFEPKLTRSKVKELREKQRILPWPMSTPVKQVEPETKALLEEEFPDESSSDEDYKPNEEECPSEEDNIVGSPKSADLDSSICEKPASPPAKPEEDADDDAGLVIALPEPEPDPECASLDNEADKIALRTRSKLPLNDTPLEAIEASFVAPDITVDMYDTHCDDEQWLEFLRELAQPIDALVSVEKPDEEPDDAEEDPEYNALEDDDAPDELDLRFDNTMKIPRKELNALIYEYDQSVFNEGDEDEEETEVPTRTQTPVSEANIVNTVRTQWMTAVERLQLEEQMRMYVQLLTQSYLLSFGVPELNFINLSSKLFLDEIKMFAARGNTVNEQSAFYAHNLDGALDIVNEYENNRNKIRIRPNANNRQRGYPGIHATQIKRTLFNSKVFIYPELLPACGFLKNTENRKALFTPAEDNLIALGLEQFSFSKTPVYYIQALLVPSKTEDQIKVRIKNSKSKSSLENPIKYYLTFKQAPPFPRIIKMFDPNNVKAPKDYPPEVLPSWMRIMCNSVLSVPPILPKTSTSAVCVSTVKRSPPKRRYRRLLPRNVQFSPLKQISPILKKYSQKRLVTSSSMSNSTNRMRKTVHFAKKIIMKSPALSPKFSSDAKQTIKKKVFLNNNLHSSVNSVKAEIENVNPNTAVINNGEDSPQNMCNETCLVNREISKMTQCVPDIGSNECDGPTELEVTDEGDEEVNDDEPESSIPNDSTLASNIINKKQSVNKKKNKQQRDLESSLALLQPHLLENDPKKEERETLFANSYLLRVTEALKGDTDTCEKFLKILCKYQHNAQSPVKLYFEIKDILKDYPALANDFIAFLSPEQARTCGKYKEYLVLSKIRAFIRKVEIHFQNQPQHLLKILRTFAQFRQQSSITSTEVLSILQPLMKNQSHLMEELINLLPDMAPCENLMTDFEEVTIPNSDDDNSRVDSCEEIVIPDAPDPYGGKDCPCECHTSSTEAKVLNKIRHCVKCGVKFMDGRVYIQTGKVLKPAQVVYHDAPPEPVLISNGDTKTFAKNKQSTSSSSIKNHVITTDQSSKPEFSQAKKDPVKTSVPTQTPNVPVDEPVMSTSKLPCDVIEDTVFPAVPVVSNKKSVPPDFSHLKDVIGSTKDKNDSPNRKFNVTDNPVEAANTTEQVEQSSADAHQKPKWSRDEDELIIYNCQRFGITEKAFEMSSATLKSRTPEEVQERFVHLMNLLSQEFNIQ